MRTYPTNAAIAATLMFVSNASLAQTTITRGPYLQLSTPDSITIRWRTDSPTDSRVWYRTPDGSTDTSHTEPALTTEHIVTLTDLAPDTPYIYAVGSSAGIIVGDDEDHRFTTAPEPGSTRPVRVWVAGDSGTGQQSAIDVRDSFLANTTDRAADLWLMLGDNAYVIGSDYDHQIKLFDIYPSILRNTVLYPSIGNHDAFSSDSPTQTGPYFDIFTLPDQAQAGGIPSGTEAYYSFDFAHVHFVCLDTSETDHTPGSPMLQWLESDLASTAQDWVIAFFHHPPYSDGHDSDMADDLIAVREQIAPVLEAGGVDLVLNGHSHSYERSFLLNGHYGLSETLTPEMVLDPGDGREDGDGAYIKPNPGIVPNSGTVYAVAGNAGQLTGLKLEHPVMTASRFELGSMILDISANRLDARSINDQGAINDHFTIIKTSPCAIDLNNDGDTDFFDLAQFLQTQPDWNNDTSFDFFDINAYLTEFVEGCP